MVAREKGAPEVEIHLHVFLVEACESVEAGACAIREVRATKAEVRKGSRDEAFLVRTEAAPGGGLRRAKVTT